MTHAPTPAAPDRDAASTLTYEGMDIRQRGLMLNLTDMWRAAGSTTNRRPTVWLDMEETKRFRAFGRRQVHAVMTGALLAVVDAPGSEVAESGRGDGLAKGAAPAR